MRGQRALLGLVILMGVLILAGTATLVGVVVHRLAAGHAPGAVVAPVAVAPVAVVPGAVASGAVAPGTAAAADTMADSGDAILFEPPGTRIQSMVRQSDTLLCIALSGGGPDRVLVWDLAGRRRVAELTLAP